MYFISKHDDLFEIQIQTTDTRYKILRFSTKFILKIDLFGFGCTFLREKAY